MHIFSLEVGLLCIIDSLCPEPRSYNALLMDLFLTNTQLFTWVTCGLLRYFFYQLFGLSF